MIGNTYHGNINLENIHITTIDNNNILFKIGFFENKLSE